MNLFASGPLSALMKPHFYRKINPVQIARSCLRQNIFCKYHPPYDDLLGAASRSVALQHDLVQKTMTQLHDHNGEECEGLYTRPTLDLYFCNKYWNFLTADLSKEQISDLEKAKKQLEHYERLFSVMEYGNDIQGLLTAIETRVANQNPSVFLTIYRNVSLILWFIMRG